MENLLSKANKVISVIWQISEKCPQELRRKTQRYSLDFLIQLSFEKWEEAIHSLNAVRNIFRLASTTGIIKLVNFEILSQEISKLENSIYQFEEASKQANEPDLREVFSMKEENSFVKAEALAKIKGLDKKVQGSSSVSGPVSLEEFISGKKIFNDLDTKQTKIVNFLFNKKSGAKVSEINRLFPTAAPRTVRRELKELFQRNILIKDGVGKSVTYSLNRKVLRT